MRLCLAALLLLAAAGCRTAPPAVARLDFGDPKAAPNLQRGFYPAAQGVRWRWTSRQFAFALQPPSSEQEVYLEFEYNLPEELMNEVGSATLIGSVNGLEVGRETRFQPGHYVFTRFIPTRALARRPATIEFELDRSTRLPGDNRLIGLNAIAASLSRYEGTLAAHAQRVLLERQGYAATMEHLQLQLPAQQALELRQSFARLPGLQKLRFQNIPIRENPLDLWALQQLLWETQPEAILATNTAEGGLPLYLAQTLDGLARDHTRIYALDPAKPAPQAQSHFLAKKFVDFLQGDPASDELLAPLRKQLQGKSALVILRPGPDPEKVLAQLRAYAPFVRAGGYLVVEETDAPALNGVVGAENGPYQALQKFLAEPAGQGFETDRSREMALFTSNAAGYLRRR